MEEDRKTHKAVETISTPGPTAPATYANPAQSLRRQVAVPVAAAAAAKLPSTLLVAVPSISNLRENALGTPPSSNRSSADVITNTSYAAVPPVAVQHVQREKEEKDRVRLEYDVYARPFIPSNVRAVNREPGHVLSTDTVHQIDSAAYIDTFLGKSFVPEQVANPNQQLHLHTSFQKGALSADSYYHYFQALIQSECAAKELENENYALYRRDLRRVFLPGEHDDQLFSLSIPGLREDAPRIEMGDVLQLRQLWLDAFRNLIAIPIQMADPNFHRPVLLTWGGTQYNASVYSVNRAQEVVYLRIAGFVPSDSGGTMGLNMPSAVVNVVFPLKERDLKAHRSALSIIATNLNKACSDPEPLSAHEELSPRAADIISAASNHVSWTNGTSAGPPKEEQGSNQWIRRMLFPTEVDGVVQTKLRTIPTRRGLFDHNMNYEQLQGINSVCENEYGVLPFLISGPPGTGKTKTLVELALNLLNSTDIGHVLICAPSDSAADTLAQRLKQHLTPKQLFRLNGPNRADNEVPQDLLPYCYMENGMFYLPPFAQLMAHIIVVTSCRDASLLADVRLTNSDIFTAELSMQSAFHSEMTPTPPALHWGALLIDEAAQATEIDVLPVLSVVMPPSTYPDSMPQPRLAMAGDQNQLGPRTASRDPAYSLSLFERLFSRPLYANHALSRSKIRPSSSPPVMTAKLLPMLYPAFTNLTRNYRSHPAILSVPSQLFYADTLNPEAIHPPSPLQASSLWQGRKWPILFIAHTGADEIERDGGGWYNLSEAKAACNLAHKLTTESHVPQKDITIMSPFAAQVRILRRLIRSPTYNNGQGLWAVNIGPLEAFQGLESRVVIIGTTRTRARFLAIDCERGLGIVHQQRRMNVALTRAKEALFVIGSPDVLRLDPAWRAFLAFCARNGLVDPAGVPGHAHAFGQDAGTKIGRIERTLLVKEDRRAKQDARRALGARNVPWGLLGAEYDAWTAGVRAALDAEYVFGDVERGHDDEWEDDGDYDGEEEAEGEEEEEAESSGGVLIPRFVADLGPGT